MAMDIEQSQRRDINTILGDRVGLGLDEENIASSPYLVSLSDWRGNNWFAQSNKIVKLNVTENDTIVFEHNPIPNMAYKEITKMVVSFDYEIGNVGANYPLLSNISLTALDMTNYMLVENILTTQGHIDVDCSLFNFSSNVVDTAISEQGFTIGINFNGNKSNATIKLSNVTVSLAFTNKLQSENDAVANRVSANFDTFVEEDDLVIEFLATTGSGGEFRTPVKDILGLQYYHYVLSASNYNPLIDSTVTITCHCTNTFGNNVKDKTLTLYNNGTTVGTATTDNDGIATWTLTCNNWGLQNLTVSNTTIHIDVKGLKQVKQSTNWTQLTYRLFVDESNRTAILSMNATNNMNMATGTDNYQLTGWIPSKYRPKDSVEGFIGRLRDIMMYAWNDGRVALVNCKGSALSNYQTSGAIVWNF